ncbi:MAG: FKBP-type peptidyl-prolyl cis-trans isomerase [Bacteroidetes bacterium]|nr:FKBP-type peptidyl-prolyl cis-trans isomerase [Bacteroidota bacterium]
MRFFLIITTVVFLCFSCKKSSTLDRAKLDNDVIKEYIKQHQLVATETGSGLFYVIEHQGSGANPSSTSNVTVAYKGYLLNGTIFDQSGAGGVNMNLSGVIQGWKEGIPYFKTGGGKGKLLIPSVLGYGSEAQSSIPANSVLIFDITLP